MYREQDETGSMLTDSVSTFMQHEHSLERLRSVRAGHPAHDREMWSRIAAQGWLGIRLAERHGGSGLPLRHAAAVAESFGSHLLPEPITSCALMPAVLADFAVDNKAWAPLVQGVADGSLITAVAWQDDAHSLLPQYRGTLVVARGETLLVTGTKHAVNGAGLAHLFLVSAMQDGSPVLLAVPRSASGVTLHEVTTSDGGSMGTLRMKNVELDAGAILLRGDAVKAALALAIDEATLAVSAQLNGVGAKALEITLEYMRTRVQFGRAIGSFQSLQHLAVNVRLQNELAVASYQSALAQQEKEPGTAATRAAIAAAKARASDAAIGAGSFGVQAHGAIGFAMEADIGLYLKSALRLAALLGNGTSQRRRFVELETLVEGEK